MSTGREMTRDARGASGAPAEGLAPARPTDGSAPHDCFERTAFLAEASRLLAQSLDYQTTLATVARLAMPELGAWCIVDVIGDDGGMERIAVIHPDPEKQALARQLASDFPPEKDDVVGIPRAMRAYRMAAAEAAAT